MPGVYAVAAVLYSKVGEAEKSEKYVEKLCSLCSEVVSDESLSDELLYGRAGYLYSLLFVKNHLGDETVSDAVLEQVLIWLNRHFASCLNASGELLKLTKILQFHALIISSY